MLVEDFREEEFGYILVGKRGDVHVVGLEARDHLNAGKILDEGNYRLTKMKVKIPFHLRSPLIVMLEVTKRCNLACKHCYIYAGEPREKEMNKEAIYKILDELKRIKVFHVFITGGEPFTRSDILDIINYAEECDFFIQIVTNGILLRETLLSHFRNRGHIGFGISYLGGLGNGLNNVEAFEILKDRIGLLKKYGFPAQCWFSVTKLNLDFMYDVGKWCLDNGVLPVYEDAMLLGRCKENSHLVLDVDDVEKNMKGLEVMNVDQPTEPHRRVRDQLSKSEDVFDICYALEHSVKACKGGRSFVYICSNGDVYPCSNCASENLFLAGNLYEKPFSEIWEKSFKDMREITWNRFKGCETCELNMDYVAGQFCKLRCPPLSKVLYDDPLYCGAGSYAKAISKIKLKRLPEWLLGGRK